MVHILGTLLPEKQLVKFALTHFYGVGHLTAARLCARTQIHDRCKIRELTPSQITSLTGFLSSPSTASTLPHFPLATPDYVPPRLSEPIPAAPRRPTTVDASNPEKELPGDKLRGLRIGAELRRDIRDNIAHLRNIGSYVGLRHALGFPVRGQRSRPNAHTARKLNRVVRYA
ncbi:mitochondrial 30S ribosomal protein S13 [Rhodofomes roseus]|uniref:Mitochondrial 30S ribosomal protein S13 n=1 Tax=Rhodofomes roseus TaxID=34475 RepID=A0ABQ8KWL1_9APHY|nr:mitochondrial 30S ribosomal protein S13 [Rhodofomes roseus]KAH9842753.1 mitochondrial 30S ribosomal protein S13 [Rhodofomes roseus]